MMYECKNCGRKYAHSTFSYYGKMPVTMVDKCDVCRGHFLMSDKDIAYSEKPGLSE